MTLRQQVTRGYAVTDVVRYCEPELTISVTVKLRSGDGPQLFLWGQQTSIRSQRRHTFGWVFMQSPSEPLSSAVTIPKQTWTMYIIKWGDCGPVELK